MSDKWEKGDIVECLISNSVAYTKGKKYTVVKNDQGKIGLVGNDGLFDHRTLLVSEFKKVVDKS